MGMLERIKKKQLEGFKDFVISLETTSTATRGQIFTSGLLEDPVFMSWVMKNMKVFDDFMNLPGEEIEEIIGSQDGLLAIFLKSMESKESSVEFVEKNMPRLISKVKDEWEYIKDVTAEQRGAGRGHLMKVARKLQQQELINGFRWDLPPMDVFYSKTYPDGIIELNFSSGTLAAMGSVKKNQREGTWVHYYDNGKILAQGDYNNGLKVGEWVFFYSNGKERARGKCINDQRHGTWKEWDREGKESEVLYKEGIKA